MKYKNTILIVKDMSRSKSFYRHVMGFKVLFEFHGYATLTSGLALQTDETWKDMIHKSEEDIVFLNHASVLSFEVEDIDDFMITLKENNVPLIHPLKEGAWGQRIVRFYDPDGHVIEVAECLRKIVKRLVSQGLSYEEAASRLQLPVDYIRKIVNSI